MSLVELLVALVIASLGLLTLVALQAASLRYTRVSERRAVGGLLADDLMERLRANAQGPGDLAYYAYSASFATQAGQAPALPAPRCDAPTDTCDVAQMAAFDLYEWRLAVRRQLPEGAVLTRHFQDPADPTQSWLDLWIAWRDPVLRQPSGVDARPAGECPSELALNTRSDATVRCMSWRVRR